MSLLSLPIRILKFDIYHIYGSSYFPGLPSSGTDIQPIPAKRLVGTGSPGSTDDGHVFGDRLKLNLSSESNASPSLTKYV